MKPPTSGGVRSVGSAIGGAAGWSGRLDRPPTARPREHKAPPIGFPDRPGGRLPGEPSVDQGTHLPRGGTFGKVAPSGPSGTNLECDHQRIFPRAANPGGAKSAGLNPGFDVGGVARAARATKSGAVLEHLYDLNSDAVPGDVSDSTTTGPDGCEGRMGRPGRVWRTRNVCFGGGHELLGRGGRRGCRWWSVWGAGRWCGCGCGCGGILGSSGTGRPSGKLCRGGGGGRSRGGLSARFCGSEPGGRGHVGWQVGNLWRRTAECEQYDGEEAVHDVSGSVGGGSGAAPLSGRSWHRDAPQTTSRIPR